MTYDREKRLLEIGVIDDAWAEAQALMPDGFEVVGIAVRRTEPVEAGYFTFERESGMVALDTTKDILGDVQSLYDETLYKSRPPEDED